MNIKDNTHQGASELAWDASEFVHRKKDEKWYTTTLLVGCLVVGISFFFKNYLFLVFTIFAVVAIIALGAREPRTIRFALTDRGVRMGNILHPYRTLESFWIREDEKLLVLKSATTFSPFFFIPLEGVPENVVRARLLRHLEETPHEKTFLEWLAEYINF